MTAIDVQVGASADDADEGSNGVVSIIRTPLANIDEANEWNGFRFTGITIPAAATITAAYLTVVIPTSTLDEPDVTIYGEKSATPAQFAVAANNISGRSRTTASVIWGSANAGQSAVNTSDIKTIIQELVNAYGPYSNGAMAFLLTSRGLDANRDCSIQSWDGSTSDCAKLHIDYTAAAVAKKKKRNLPMPGGVL